jgi:hypothetical protein
VEAQQKTLTVKNYDDFRDKIPTTGLFEMLDCRVEFWCPLDSDTVEVQRMVNLIESMVHVVDVKIGSKIEDSHFEHYQVVITESESPTKKFRRERR